MKIQNNTIQIQNKYKTNAIQTKNKINTIETQI